QDAEAAGELADTTRREMSAAGLDPALCPRVPSVPAAAPGTTVELVRAKPDPEAAAVQVERRTPPPVAPEVLDAELRAAAGQATRAAAVATQRSALTLTLHERAVAVDRQAQRLDGLRQAARQAQLEATESVGRRNEAAQRLDDAVATWRERAEGWGSAGPFGADARPPAPPSHDELRADADLARTVHDAARQWASPRLRGLRQAVVSSAARVDQVAAVIASVESELIALRGGVDPAPPAPPYATAHRDPATGAAFYQLVDFVPELEASARAGLEAALQGCGLLSAWVRADGGLEPGVAELFAMGGAAAGPTLASVLVPSVEPGCPVPVDVVAGVLAGVSLGDGGGLAVSTSGQWRAGVLAGSMAKAAAEFVGAGAREAARARRGDELTARLEVLRADRSVADVELAEHTGRVAEWERHLDAFPDDRTLIAAHATLTTATRTADDAKAKAARLRDEYDTADRHSEAAQIELTQTAAEAGLPADTATLQAAHSASVSARGSAEALRDTLVGRCVGTVRDLTDALHDHQAATDDLGDAAGAAETSCAEFAREAAALADLTAAIGGEAQQIAAQLTGLEAERRALRAELPALRTSATELSNQVVKTETLLEGKEGDIDGKATAASAAADGFRSALAAPGVLAAALPDESPADPDEALALLSTVERKGASEELVITKLQALQTALAGSHEITPERHAGILTITVAGEQGPRPVAEAARQVSEQLARQRGFLGERYQDIFATFMLRNLAERLHGQISVAEDLTRRMNDVLDVARSSQGVHVRLEWRPSAALDETTLEALKLVRTPFADRTEEQDAMLRRAFTERIDAERDTHSGGYAEILTRALDYRSWYTFTVRVADNGPDGRPRTRRMRQLSSGETRLVSYVTLFAAAAAFYGAISGSTADDRTAAGPLRLVLLDEAFERLDDPTVARMLGLLVDLDMDWIITWPSGWGVSDRIPRMHIYDVLRPKSGRGVACTHTTWDGADLSRADG
ncbi:MAG TPA: SbcC/MukB-like Walker B domain-containing protein, partial [Pseudonocardiaceae bacterium]|nr:SbcC/MukB-like Walker B domain-containing protein [Pseudonocardiaceae bacterium]